ncbi:MAG: epimerase [Opitutus sp.]|nr:epimerase [Opitutus sp.]
MNRRDLLKLGAAAGASALLPRVLAQTAPAPAAKPKPVHVGAAEGVARAEKPLNILILGGTGFTGPHQVSYALARGHKLTLFNRGRRPKEWPGEVEEITGDRETGDLKSLEGREWDVCIDNPTSIPSWVRDVGQVLKGKVKHYIFISTISVYRDDTPPGRDESVATQDYTGADVMKETRDTLRANMALYGPLKAACEREAEKQFPGMTTVIRPSLIVGPGDETDRFTYWPVRIARGGEILAPGDGLDPVQFIDARDCAEWTIRVAEQRTLGIFNAAGPSYTLGMAAMLHGIRAATTAHAEFTWVDWDFLREQNVSPWGDMPAWIPRREEGSGLARVSIEKAKAAGLTFRSLADTTAATLAYWNALPAERRAALRAGIKAEREAEVLKAWHAKAKS